MNGSWDIHQRTFIFLFPLFFLYEEKRRMTMRSRKLFQKWVLWLFCTIVVFSLGTLLLTPNSEAAAVEDVEPLEGDSLVVPISSPSSRLVHAKCGSLPGKSEANSLVNGVILFLAANERDYFFRKALPLLEENFLAYFPYPVHIFHEEMPMEIQRNIRRVIPSARQVDFEDVSRFWKTLPHNVTEGQLTEWMETPQQRRHHKRGYRIMCRFWAGLAWQLPSMNAYEYYWRLDTDSYLTRRVPCDVFRVMQVDNCVYGYERVTDDSLAVVKELWPTFLRWGETALSPVERKGMSRFFLRGGEYTRRMYYNNFELGAMKIKRHPLYESLFGFLDTQQPLGILRYRWGDAPIHTLGVEAVMQREGWKKCDFGKNFAGYRHGKY